MNQVVIGFGEIGKAVRAVIGEGDVIDLVNPGFKSKYDVMHICFPYSDTFVKDVKNYIQIHKPDHVIIYSTIPIGTTRSIGPKTVHSPVEGKHPDLELSIRQMERWLGCHDANEAVFFASYFMDLGLRTRIVDNSDYTEALKLLSTTEYGVNLVFADYKAYVAEKIGMNFELTKEWNREYNKLYKNLGMEKRFQKFVLDPPQGKIGGHCVTQNAKLLQKLYPDELIKRVGDMQ